METPSESALGVNENYAVDVRSMAGRLLKGGLPAVVSGAVVVAVPVLANLIISTDEYAIWSLGATIATISVVLDLGMPALAIKLAAERSLNLGSLAKLAVLSSAPSVAIGVIAAVVWPLYASTAGLVNAESGAVSIIFLMIGVGGAARSAAVVIAGAALGAERWALRSVVLLSGAVVLTFTTAGMLVLDFGLWALGVGTLVSGVVQLAIAMPVAPRLLTPADQLSGENSSDASGLIRLFMRSRGAVALIGLSITQLDRWVLGLVSQPAVLAQYDIATRLILMPKVALIGISAGLVGEAGRGRSVRDRLALLSRSNRLLLAASLPAMATAAAISIPIQNLGTTALNPVLVAGVLGVAHLTNLATLPATQIFAGIGRPDIELKYLLPLFGAVSFTYLLSIVLGSALFFILGWSLAMIACSLFFVSSARGYLRGSSTE